MTIPTMSSLRCSRMSINGRTWIALLSPLKKNANSFAFIARDIFSNKQYLIPIAGVGCVFASKSLSMIASKFGIFNTSFLNNCTHRSSVILWNLNVCDMSPESSFHTNPSGVTSTRGVGSVDGINVREWICCSTLRFLLR